MNAISAAYKELVFGGHLLALGTSSMAASVAILLGNSPPWDLLLMAYLFSLGAYTINRISDFEEDRVSHPDRTSYLERRKGSLKWIAAGCFLLGYSLAFLRNLVFFGALLVPLLLALVYSVGWEKLKGPLGVTRLKEGLVVKNVAISFGWSLVPVLVGLYYIELPWVIFALMPYVFLRLMVNTIFFDQRDVEADRSFGVKTLPGRLGIPASTRVIDALDVCSGAYILGAALLGAVPLFAGAFVMFTFYSFAYRRYAGTGRHKDTARDLAADGEYLLWGVVAYIGHL